MKLSVPYNQQQGNIKKGATKSNIMKKASKVMVLLLLGMAVFITDGKVNKTK